MRRYNFHYCKNCRRLKSKIEKLEKQLFVTNRRLMDVEAKLGNSNTDIRFKPPAKYR